MADPTIQETRRTLQAELKAKMDSVEQLRVNATKAGSMDEATAKTIDGLLNSTDPIRLQLKMLGREEELRDWAHSSSTGGAYTASTYSADDQYGMRRAGPLEGSPLGEAIIRQDWKSGELVAENESAEPLLEALKSPSYKSAWNKALRSEALKQMGRDTRKWQMSAKEQTAMKVVSEGTDTAGGLWVTPEFNSTFIKKLPTMAVLAPNAFHITVGSDRVSFPKLKYTTDDKYTSPARYSWSNEAPSSDLSETTDPSAARPEINIYTALCAIIVTRASMEDTQFDLMGLLSQVLSEAYILGDEDTIANADGVGKPNGVLNHPNASVASSSGGMYVASGQTSTLDWGIGTNVGKGITGLDAALPPQYEAGAAYYANKATYNAVRALVDGEGRPLWGAGDSYPNFANGQQASLLGSPVRKSQFLPDVTANLYPLWYGDMQGYWIADRVGITVEVLREVRALKDEVVIYARKRWGGQLIRDWSMKLLKVASS